MLIAQSSFWTNPESWWAIAQVCIGLGLVIFVHELGHFLVAKACGVKCEKFYIGFDFFDIKIGDLVLIPRSLVKFQWGETEYGVGILPLGGYVKMLGQDDNPGNMEQEIARSKAGGEDDKTESLGVLDRDQIDPRSYLAKSVPQRMAIISAGVIFNLIFAVLFATVAFKSGVEYNPPIIGDVVPGGPAWEANLYGAHITKVGDSEVKDYFPFMDLAQEVALSGGEEEIPFEYTAPNSEEVVSVSLMPRKGLRDDVDLALVGIRPPTIPKVTSGDSIFIEGHSAILATPSFEKNDKIVELAGSPVENIFDLKKTLAANFDKPLKFVVERGEEATKQIEIEVDRNPMRTAGLVMEWGPVKAIQRSSPASAAGIQVGDQIAKINYESPGNLYTLEQRMTKIARDGIQSDDGTSSSTVELEILRDGKTVTVEIEPRMPLFFAQLENNQPVAINSLGIAIESTRKVASSQIPGIQAGDQITNINFDINDKKSKEVFEEYATNAEIDLVESKTSWTSIQTLTQNLPEGFEFTVSATRGGKDGSKVDGKHKTMTENGYYLPTRGVLLTMMQETYQSPNWADAFKFGYQQTYKDASRVFKFLGKLVTGQISPKNLGGPGMIAAVATSEATQGTSRLLLFLVLLSANLAIVNFLPIPVLDGGHMLFLAYEGIFQHPPNEKVQIILTYAGLFMILGLMLFVIFLDIQRFSGWL